MKRLVFWAGCSRLWVRVAFVCKVCSLSVCIFSLSWLMRTALSQRRNGVDRVVFSNNLPGTEQWKERDFIYSWWTDRGLCWELAKSQRQKERPQGWGTGVLRPSKATGFHWCAQPKGVRTWVAPDTCLGEKKSGLWAQCCCVPPELGLQDKAPGHPPHPLWPPETQGVPKHAWWMWQTSGHRRGLLFLAWSQAWAGPGTEEAPDCPQMSERRPAGRPAGFQAWFPFQWRVGRGDPSHGTKGSVLGARHRPRPWLGTPPSGHELHTFKSVHFWVQEHWVLMFAGDKCWLCFVLSMVTHPQPHKMLLLKALQGPQAMPREEAGLCPHMEQA